VYCKKYRKNKDNTENTNSSNANINNNNNKNNNNNNNNNNNINKNPSNSNPNSNFSKKDISYNPKNNNSENFDRTDNNITITTIDISDVNIKRQNTEILSGEIETTQDKSIDKNIEKDSYNSKDDLKIDGNFKKGKDVLSNDSNVNIDKTISNSNDQFKKKGIMDNNDDDHNINNNNNMTASSTNSNNSISSVSKVNSSKKDIPNTKDISDNIIEIDNIDGHSEISNNNNNNNSIENDSNNNNNSHSISNNINNNDINDLPPSYNDVVDEIINEHIISSLNTASSSPDDIHSPIPLNDKRK